MIESSVIEWLDFGDSIQKIDTYSKANYLTFWKNKNNKINISHLFKIIYIYCAILIYVCRTSYQ